MLAEGSSIRAIERVTGLDRNTIMNLGGRAGTACKAIMDEKFRGLTSSQIQVDEIWGFIENVLGPTGQPNQAQG